MICQFKSKMNYRKFRKNAQKLLSSTRKNALINKKELTFSVETQNLIKLRRRRGRELKYAAGYHYTSLRTEVIFLQKEIKQSMRRSEDRERTKSCKMIRVAFFLEGNKRSNE